MKVTTIFLKVAVIFIGIFVLTLCIFWLPFLAEEASSMNPEYAHLRYPVLIGLYLTTLPFYLALYQALKILEHIKRGNAFSQGPITALGIIKYCASTIFILYVLGMFFLAFENALHPGIAIVGFVIIFATIVILLFASVFQELLKSAFKIKIENDLTV